MANFLPRKLTFLLVFWLALGSIASCAEGVEQGVDADNDGFEDTVDCNDAEPDANPEAVEICDGIDNDCDGTIDEPDANGAATWYLDKDGDGHGMTMETVVACNQPDGYTGQKGDCQDDDPKIHPGAKEDCSSNIDANCDGSTGYADEDEDGHAACVDCDDADPEINPGATEICDGIDNDCDSLTDDADVPVDMLCGSVANGTAVCNGEDGCGVDHCDANYYDANATFEDGCECLADPLPITDAATCETAIDLGTFSDVNADTKSVTGNGVPPGRSIWYTFSATDDTDTKGDEFHVDVRFTTNPMGAYQIDVYRNGCPGTGVELATGETEIFDWYTDQNYTKVGCTQGKECGEGNCTTTTTVENKNKCSDNSATFQVRVTRTDGLPSCDAYGIEFSNGVYKAK